MLVTPLPPVPVAPNAVQQDAVARTLPQVQAQSAAPIIQRAVDPSAKSERGNKSRSNEERAKNGGDDKNSRGSSVNIRV